MKGKLNRTFIAIAGAAGVSLFATTCTASQSVELTAKIETEFWDTRGPNPPSISTRIWTVHCLVDTNTWLIEGDFLANGKDTWWFTGTNMIEESRITSETPEATTKKLSELSRLAMRSPRVGERNRRTIESIDGNPGRPVRVADLMFAPAKIAWLAYCSGPALKREGRRIPLPSDLWKELMSPSWQTSEKTTTFEDELGLPEKIVLHTGKNQPVLQYRAVLATNVLGWTFPLEFHLAQYTPIGSNEWELHLTANGKIIDIGEGAAPGIPVEKGKSAEGANHPRADETYTITSVLQVLKPADPADMSDDFQAARVLAQDKDSYTVAVTYFPLNQPAVEENPNWRKDDADMTAFLKPTPSENWDEGMQRDLLAELRQAGIDPDQLTDKQLVQQVSQWAMKRAHSTDAFSIWGVYFPEGKPAVYPPLREAFDHQKPSPSWTDQQMFEQEALGRAMFYNKVHGSCTSSAVYLATILRALGIPTRIVFCIPPFDPNDQAQARMFYDNVHHHRARETVRAALDGTSGFANHLFNEVFVGHRWVRLNYGTLGQPILDAHYFGLLTHIYTCADLSQVPLAQTWGMRYFQYPAGQPKLSSQNPYRLISVTDCFGANARVDNPPVPPAELRTVTIIGLYPKGSPQVPSWVRADTWQKPKTDFLIAGKEWLPGSYHQMRAFETRVGHEFLLTAPGHPTIKAHLNRLCLSQGDGTFQAYGAQFAPEDEPKLEPGVAYSIQPVNTSEIYQWTVAPDIQLLFRNN
ncbi:MAG TPA: transglutaminase domain-containing protein [Verrucomicrobiae bacterium]|nr:transglutaminase domain-containing protein [Verrucomicrobiae bacterium]